MFSKLHQKTFRQKFIIFNTLNSIEYPFFPSNIRFYIYITLNYGRGDFEKNIIFIETKYISLLKCPAMMGGEL